MKVYEKYYLLTGGEILSQAEIFRLAYIARIQELNATASSFGASGFTISPTSMLLSGLRFDGEVPEGFKKPDNRGVSIPRKNNIGARLHFQNSGSVHRFKPLQDFCDWLGCPESYRYSTECGSTGQRCIGHPFQTIEMYWFSAESPIALKIPDVAKYDAMAAEQSEQVEDNVLSWRMNHNGAEEILYERWQLMEAEHKAIAKAGVK